MMAIELFITTVVGLSHFDIKEAHGVLDFLVIPEWHQKLRKIYKICYTPFQRN